MNETAFLGRVTAVVMHDLQNVLATIKEASGLIDDLLPMTKGIEPKRKEQFQRSLSHIKEQVDRGARYAEQLNSFGHSMEDSEKGVDLEFCARQIVFLTQRQARMKRIEFVVEPAEKCLLVPGNRFQVMMAVFVLMEACLSELPAQSKMLIQAEAVNQAPSLRFEWLNSPNEGMKMAQMMTSACDQIVGNLPSGVTLMENERNASVCLLFA